MNPEAQQELQRIIDLGPDAISPADADFLRARRDYLNSEQKRVFASVLKAKPVEKVEEQPEEVVEDEQSEQSSEDQQPESSLNDLRARAKELGINSFGKKKEELQKLIEEAEAAQS